MAILRAVAVLAAVFLLVHGHGMVTDPPNRSSVWRYFDGAPINYDDNQEFCGGRSVQWDQNGGKCGVCGDDYALARPRDNENTGTYGQGLVVATYDEGSVITVTVTITANHNGTFVFTLCKLDDPSTYEPENCFEILKLADGSYTYDLPSDNTGDYKVDVQLPTSLTCDRCVLQWTWTTANSWGVCSNGTGAIGCGPQETFRTCSDIAIVAKS